MDAVTRLAVATTAAVLARVAESAPDAEAVVGEDGRVGYLDLASRSAELATRLHLLALGESERVGLLMRNGIRWCIAALAGHIAGLSVVPLSTWARADDLAYAVRKARVRVLIAEREIFGHDFAADLASVAEAESVAVFLWPKDDPVPSGLPAAVEQPWSEVVRQSPARPASEAFVLFTSGSTSRPKAVALTHEGLIRNGHAVGERHGVRPGDRIWVASPLFFVFGCGNAFPNALTHAATLCVQERFEAGRALPFIERERCTVYYGLASMTRDLLTHPAFGRHDVSTLRTGCAVFTKEEVTSVVEELGVRDACNAYGMTETFGHSTMSEASDDLHSKATSQGRALPTQQVRVVADDGRPADIGATGQIQVRGLITPGYLDDPELNAASFTADGWFRTGDLGWLDDEQRLHYVGRSTEMMKVKGVKVSPAEIEAVLAEQPAVDQVYVFGIPMTSADDEIAAAIVPRNPGYCAADLTADLQRWVKDHATGYKVPKYIVFFADTDLPTTDTGKLSRRLLRDIVAMRVASRPASS
jgi:HIP---CoA ligase